MPRAPESQTLTRSAPRHTQYAWQATLEGHTRYDMINMHRVEVAAADPTAYHPDWQERRYYARRKK